MYFETIIKKAHGLGYPEIKDCHPFILPEAFIELTKRTLGETDMVTIDPDDQEQNDRRKGILDNPLPFKVCCFESIKPLATPSDPESKKPIGLEVLALAAIEKTPLDWDFFILFHRVSDKKQSIMKVDFNSKKPEDKIWAKAGFAAIQSILYFLKETFRMASETSPRKIKVGKKGQREFVKVKNIVHVFSKKEKSQDIKPVYGGKIDYSHRFEVRGHWRRVDTIGRDRSGNYSVKGFTWVNPFVKGDEDLPLIRKTRIIHTEQGQPI